MRRLDRFRRSLRRAWFRRRGVLAGRVLAGGMLSLLLLLAGCGPKNAADVVHELDKLMAKLESYETDGKMILKTGGQDVEYTVSVWYRKPHYYRISLMNESNDVTQIVLRNDEGVFVLTPHLNKMFRFQSDWPERSGQVYLYQSLVHSIVSDQNRKFATDKDAFVFDVAANYANNSMLARQKIWLDKKSFAPRRVEVSDANANVLVEMRFDRFEFGKKFEAGAFDMQWNMSGPRGGENAQPQASPGAPGQNAASVGKAQEKRGASPGAGAASRGEPGGTAGTSDGRSATNTERAGADRDVGFGVVRPSYTPPGVREKDVVDLRLDDAPAVMLRYEGTYHYTLTESRPREQTVSMLAGEPVDLGFTVGVLVGDEPKTLVWWTEDGVEFRLSSAELPVEEMVRIARSTEGETGK